MSVVSIYTSEDQYIDLGLMVDATVSFDGIASIHHSLNDSRVLRQIVKTCCVCNNAQVGHDNTLVGQSTDCALLSLGIKCGYFPETLSIKRLGETPFSSETKWMSVQVEDPEFSHPIHYIKGAPEIILSKCTTYMNQNQLFSIKDDFLFRFHSKISNFSSNGFRTLAVAYGDSSGDYIFLGLVMLADPIRPDIAKTLANFRSLGVECKILTGDSKETACSVAQSVVITDFLLKSVSGDQLRSASKLEMNKMISEAHLFYRITPVDKINIVKSLRKQGHVVAMAGDGVNDAIALRAAHVGISMGKFASDACKEAADVVLTDDNIKSLIWAVREGKTIFKNIQNFVRFQISSYCFGFTLS
uniref:Calcium-transporting ATPase type 2C member 1 (Trinotate prediction) n=1 Tax=Myxobolus squamalis TaxID=59785 RepID=A0A6B2FY23_MYXSQ